MNSIRYLAIASLFVSTLNMYGMQPSTDQEGNSDSCTKQITEEKPDNPLVSADSQAPSQAEIIAAHQAYNDHCWSVLLAATATKKPTNSDTIEQAEKYTLNHYDEDSPKSKSNHTITQYDSDL